MGLEMFGQFMGSYGFPIAACIVMGWYVKYITDKHREELHEVNEKHQHEMDGVKEALNNNTLALKELSLTIKNMGERE